MNIPASSKYAIIREMTQRDNNLLNITWLCAAAPVFRGPDTTISLKRKTSDDNVKNKTKRIF